VKSFSLKTPSFIENSAPQSNKSNISLHSFVGSVIGFGLAATSAFSLATPIMQVNASAQAQGAASPVVGVASLGSTTSNGAYSVSGLYSATSGAYAATNYITSAYAGISGGGTASSSLQLNELIVNNTDKARLYNFTFQIAPGYGSASAIVPLTTGEYARWGYLINVGISSTSGLNNLFTSGATVSLTGSTTGSVGNITTVAGHTALDNASQSITADGVNYRWSTTTISREFRLEAFSSASLIYDMAAFTDGAAALYSTTCNEGYGDGYGYGEYGVDVPRPVLSAQTATVCENTKISTNGTTRDPGDLTSTAVGSLSSRAIVADVPLPGGLALLGLGMTIGVVLKSKKKKMAKKAKTK
jgi:hypothetical protein